jgi:hypothetical protein
MNAAEAESYARTAASLPPHKRTVGDEAAVALVAELKRQAKVMTLKLAELHGAHVALCVEAGHLRAEVERMRDTTTPIVVCHQCRERLPCRCGAAS